MHNRLYTGALVLGAIACLLAGCEWYESPKQSPPPPPLTGERARQALIIMLQSEQALGGGGDGSHFDSLDLEDLAQAPVESWEEGACWVGKFLIRLRQLEYHISFGGPNRCTFHYRGTFEVKDGQWVALPPRCESVACGK